MEELQQKSAENREKDFPKWLETASEVDLKEALDDYRKEADDYSEKLKRAGYNLAKLMPTKEDGWPDDRFVKRGEEIQKRIPLIEARLLDREKKG